ncbi:MAG: glutamate--tRNA ligase [Candidatus Nanoarchaeia archaeon]|nr:glutamate--tRNA ligase [Candidatus Nanoarchaeia archaeon]
MDKDLVLKHALNNAVKHNGTCMNGSVIAGVLGEKPELKNNIKELAGEVGKTVVEVNSMSKEEQVKKLEELAPEFLEEKKPEKKELPELPNAKKRKVIICFPPEPSGYPHLGHAYASLINYMYSEKYDGKFILRFEDTNPKKSEKKFYREILWGMRWLGIDCSNILYMSDNIPRYYSSAEKLMKKGHLYVCSCAQSTIKDYRMKQKECRCRIRKPIENLKLWKDMLSGNTKSGDYIVRLKADMKSKNTAMRDPTMFRIIKSPHPRTEEKYIVWPNYDFSASIEDSKITHRFRDKGFELRVEVQNYIRKLLGLKNPWTYEFARLNIQGSPTSKRETRELILENKITGWDDFRIATLRGLKRRGIQPEAIKELVKEVGYSKAEKTIDMDMLEAFNRKALDAKAHRYFFVPHPIELEVIDAPEKKLLLKKHPHSEKEGVRRVHTKKNFYIDKADMKDLKAGSVFRLKELYNVMIVEKSKNKIKASFMGDALMPDTKKIQWVTKEGFIEVDIKIPKPLFVKGKYNPNSIETLMGYAEETIRDINIDSVVQFERFGFVKLDSKKGYHFVFCHK